MGVQSRVRHFVEEILNRAIAKKEDDVLLHQDNPCSNDAFTTPDAQHDILQLSWLLRLPDLSPRQHVRSRVRRCLAKSKKLGLMYSNSVHVI